MPSVEPLLAKLRSRLEPHGQEHLLAGWEGLDSAARRHLAEAILGLDFELLARLHRQQADAVDYVALARRAVAPPAFRCDGQGNRIALDEARTAGEALLSAGRVGALLVAGGQGTRLGFPHPKGLFPVGPVSGATLFQILIEKVRATARRYHTRIPLYLMTSPATHDETLEFLAEHDRFGLAADDLFVFCQGTMPAVDAASGQVLLAAPGEIFLSPDGHGGMLAALERTGGLDDMRRRGLSQLHYFQIDNPLTVVCDPVFLGYHHLSGSEMSTQVVAKTLPDERVGNVVLVDGQVQIIEYSDLPTEAAARRSADGQLELWAGNIAVHVFDVEFLDRCRGEQDRLPFHVARKKVPYLDATGTLVEPDAENAFKFERFIFDLLPAARNAIVMEVDARRVFAPVKNRSGSASDSPETVRAQMSALAREWLSAAGATVNPQAVIEISPLFALDAEDVARHIPAGTHVEHDTLFCPRDASIQAG